MSCRTIDEREAPSHHGCQRQDGLRPLAVMDGALHERTSCGEPLRHLWNSLSYSSPDTVVKDPPTKRAPWPTITLSADDSSVVSELSNTEDLFDADETLEATGDGFDVDMEIPKDSWIIQLIGDGGNCYESGDTPWFRVLKQGSHGYLMLEGDEVLQLLHAMIRDASSKRQPEPELYIHTPGGPHTTLLSASEAISYFRALLKSMTIERLER